MSIPAPRASHPAGARFKTRRAAIVLAGMSLALLVLATACAPDAAGRSSADASAPLDPDVTFYVIGFHWGWAVFDEDGNELDGIRVTEGTNVEVYAANGHAAEAIDRFPAPVAATIKSIEWAGERTRLEIEAGRLPDPEVLIGMKLEDVLGHDDADDHGDDADDHADDADDHADDADEHADDADDHADDADEHADDADEHADDADDHADDADAHTDEGEDDADDHTDGDDDPTGDLIEHVDAADADAVEHADEDLVGGTMPASQMPWLSEERELETHGFLIPWYGVAAKLEPDASEPVHAVFTADRPGTFEFECVVYCGFGHRYQQRDMLFVAPAP